MGNTESEQMIEQHHDAVKRDRAYDQDALDAALSGLEQLRYCQKMRKECEPAWRQYWEVSCEFWIQSIKEWLSIIESNKNI